MKLLTSFFVIGHFFFESMGLAYADSNSNFKYHDLEVMRSNSLPERISSFVFVSTWEESNSSSATNKRGLIAKLRLRWVSPIPPKKVIYRTKLMPKDVLSPLRIGETKDYEFSIPMMKNELEFQITAESTDGKVQHEFLKIKEKIPPNEKPLKKWSHEFSFSLVFFSYSELNSRTQYQLNEYSPVMRVSSLYRFTRNFTIGGGGFVAPLPQIIDRNPATVSASKFYGASARFGYKLYEDSEKSFITTLGFFYWSQRSNNNSYTYGVSSLTGPQITVQGSFSTFQNRVWSALIRLSTSSNGVFAVSNHELGLALGIPLSSIGARWPWIVTLDVSQAQYQVTALRSFTLFTCGAGLGVRFE